MVVGFGSTVASCMYVQVREAAYSDLVGIGLRWLIYGGLVVTGNVSGCSVDTAYQRPCGSLVLGVGYCSHCIV